MPSKGSDKNVEVFMKAHTNVSPLDIKYLPCHQKSQGKYAREDTFSINISNSLKNVSRTQFTIKRNIICTIHSEYLS